MRQELDDVIGRLGSRVESVEQVPWGDSNATWRVDLENGDAVAARRFRGPDAAARVDRHMNILTRVRQAGVPVPDHVASTVVDDHGWLITRWVEGVPGSRWLDTPERSIHLATAMGSLVARLATLQPGVMDGDRGTVFIHGDFAPVNVLMDQAGEITALLDFEHATTGPPASDAAWWGWVVRYHHPDVWVGAWPTFLSAAGLSSDEATQRRLHGLALRQLGRRLDGATDESARERWRQRLAIAATW